MSSQLMLTSNGVCKTDLSGFYHSSGTQRDPQAQKKSLLKQPTGESIEETTTPINRNDPKEIGHLNSSFYFLLKGFQTT